MNISNLINNVTSGVLIGRSEDMQDSANSVYFLCDESGEIVYIGQSIRNRLSIRIKEHKKSTVINFSNAYALSVVLPSDAFKIEQGLISLYRPRFNKAISWDEMNVVRAIEYLGLHLEMRPHEWTRQELQNIVAKSRENRSKVNPARICDGVSKGAVMEIGDAIEVIKQKYISLKNLEQREFSRFNDVVKRFRKGTAGHKAVSGLLERFNYEVVLVLVTKKDNAESIESLKESVLNKLEQK